MNFARQPGDRVSAQGLGFAGPLGFGLAWWLSARLGLEDLSLIILLFLLGTTLPMMITSLWANQTHRRATSGLGVSDGRATDWKRCRVKFIGLLSTLVALAFAYWLFPEYAREFYAPVWRLTGMVGIPLLLVSIGYISWVDRRMLDPWDGYWHAGLLALGRWSELDRDKLREYTLGWIVKGFFLPLMLAGSVVPLSNLLSEGVGVDTFVRLYATSLNLVYAIDVIFGAVGYLLTLRVLDSHIRSTQPTALGWSSTVLCYVPFSIFVWGTFLKYKGHIQWYDWLQAYPVLFVTWGFVIIVLHVIYVWATVSFGCRFSNLTNRGIIVDGPYRFLRHPAYVTKNLAWWMMYIPFAAHLSWEGAVKGCICLLLTNLIYYVRARTEERHLMQDPAYVAYCHWIDQNGLLACFKAWFNRGSARS